ncbi:hypothetical protein GCM10027515_28490 [Schumannella luteola]|uniref:Ribosomal protein S18 acetylase RimI-like enzyme n=1 Tax=Schumannella luteola TaxID=472059 RepID=A0A852YBY2_9MICO|nr:ribosomal protein S18 acetylase RimI-like enzyme [Schumannella luteola]
MSVEIREARPEEFDEVGELTVRGFLAGPYGHLPRSESRLALERDAAGRARDGALLVAVDGDDRLVGTASVLRAGTPYARLAAEGSDEAELRLIVVDPETRAIGVSDALVAASLETARGWGVGSLVLDTGARNERAQRLYRRAGFQRATEREHDEPGIGGIHVYRFGFGADADALLIRLVHHDELETVGRLTAAAYTSDYPDLPADYLASLIDVAGRASRDEVWVAERRADGALVGTVWTPREGQTISAVARPGELDFRLLAVDPDARGLGVGAALTRHVLRLGRERGVSQVVMNSGPEMLGAHALYAKLGFTRLSEREGPIEVAPGRFIEIYAFGYPLAGASSVSAA